MIAGIAVHISLGINLDHQADGGDYYQHDRGQRIHEDADLEGETADGQPVDIGDCQLMVQADP